MRNTLLDRYFWMWRGAWRVDGDVNPSISNFKDSSIFVRSTKAKPTALRGKQDVIILFVFIIFGNNTTTKKK